MDAVRQWGVPAASKPPVVRRAAKMPEKSHFDRTGIKARGFIGAFTKPFADLRLPNWPASGGSFGINGGKHRIQEKVRKFTGWAVRPGGRG